MYTVILVDDEPVTFKSIRRIIEKRCLEFEIIAVANNGKEGLDTVKKLKPDLVITDVKMPIMDGITFANQIKKEMQDTLVVVISGYQDFEYVRGAIESGVCDYLLKPIVPGKLVDVMERMRERLEEIYWGKRNQLMRIMCQGGQPDRNNLKRYFGNKKYYAVLVRKNGLPRRITMNKEYELFSIKQEQVIMYARDVQEGLYLYQEDLVSPMSFRYYVEKMIKKFQDGSCYTTAIASEDSFQINSFPEQVGLFYRTLAERTIIGKNQILFLEKIKKKPEERNGPEKDWFSDITYLLKHKRYDSILDAVKKLLKEWGKREKSQLWIEGKVRQLFYLLISEGYLNSTVSETEFIIEDAFFYAVTIEELEESILAEIEKKGKGQSEEILKIDTPEYFQKFKDFIWIHMSEPLTLQRICKEFGVSQPYVSRFFRKYEGTSFSNYLTEIRIKKAKELLNQNKDMLIKDVASMVGYNDQFYFSRIFRSVVGASPTEYIKS